MSAALDLGTGQGFRVDLRWYRKGEQRFRPLVHQQAVHTTPVGSVMALGGWGGAKTSTGMFEIWRRTWQFPGCRIMVGADTEPSVFRMLDDFVDDGYIPLRAGQTATFRSIAHNRSDRSPLIARVENKGRRIHWINGSVWILCYGSQPGSIDGNRAHWGLMDELSRCQFDRENPRKDTFMCLLSRCRDKPLAGWDGGRHASGKIPGPGFIGATVPEFGVLWDYLEQGEQCFPLVKRGAFAGRRICLRHYSAGKPQLAVVHCRTLDNPGIDPKAYELIASALDEDQRRQVLEGEWGRPTGAIYPKYSSTIIPWRMIKDDHRVENRWGADFGKQTGHAVLWQRLRPGHPARAILRRHHGKGPRPGRDAWVAVDEVLIDAAHGAEAHALKCFRRHPTLPIEEVFGDQQGVQVQKTDDSSQMRDWERVMRGQRQVKSKRVRHEKRKVRTRIENGIPLVNSLLCDAEGYCHLYTSAELRGRSYPKAGDGSKRLGIVAAMEQYRRENGRIRKRQDHPCDIVRYLAILFEWGDDNTARFGGGLRDIMRRGR